MKYVKRQMENEKDEQTMKKRLIIGFVILSMLAGCTVGPKYRRPIVEPPAAFRGSSDTAAASDPGSLADMRWFEVFKDEELQELIRTALVNNYDLRRAVARRMNARNGSPQIVIVDERGPNQLLKLFILENLEPSHIRERAGIGRRSRIAGATEGRRRLDDRSAILRADGTAGQHTQNDKSNYQSFLHGLFIFFIFHLPFYIFHLSLQMYAVPAMTNEKWNMEYGVWNINQSPVAGSFSSVATGARFFSAPESFSTT